MSAPVNARPRPSSGPFLAHLATTRNHEPAEQTDTWTSAGAGNAEGCSAEFSAWRFGDLTLTRAVQRAGESGHWHQQPRPFTERGCAVLLRNSRGEQASSTLVVCPYLTLSRAALAWPAGQFKQTSHPGQTCSAGQTRHPGPYCEVLTLFLPMDALDEGEPNVTPGARQLDAAVGPGALLADFMRQLAGQLVHIPEDRARLLASATRALVTACTATTIARPAPVTPSIACGMVERARLVVRQSMGSPDFGQPQLARLLAMSRSKLYRLLDGDGGVAHFIKRERLMRAWRDLTVPGEAASVHAIANQVGFRDHSTFSRAFRREFGCSPTEARERALVTQPDPVAVTRPDPMHAHASAARPFGRMG